MIGRRLFGFFVVSAVVVVLGAARSSPAQEREPSFWGTGTNFHFVNAEEFQNGFPDPSIWRHYGDGFWGFVDAGSYGEATVRLPVGSLITGMTIIYHDSNGGSDVTLKLFRRWVTVAGTAGSTQIGPAFTSSGAPGTTATWVDSAAAAS